MSEAKELTTDEMRDIIEAQKEQISKLSASLKSDRAELIKSFLSGDISENDPGDEDDPDDEDEDWVFDGIAKLEQEMIKKFKRR